MTAGKTVDVVPGRTAVLFSSHVTETVERLCQRVLLLHRGRLVRTIDRAEWGAPPSGPSPLERAFLDLLRSQEISS